MARRIMLRNDLHYILYTLQTTKDQSNSPRKIFLFFKLIGSRTTIYFSQTTFPTKTFFLFVLSSNLFIFQLNPYRTTVNQRLSGRTQTMFQPSKRMGKANNQQCR